jgi:exodeoxyribonuclease VII large subunit
MFRRAASLLDFSPRDGELVELRGRLGVYEQRGDLQLVVESMRRAGQGALFEQFLRLKASLEAEGLFEASRKRALPAAPRGIGLVTSLGAAALHDVLTALQRRVPHLPVVLAPAAVQGTSAPGELVQALSNLYQHIKAGRGLPGETPVDVILLVRGGGSLEDLWSFNSEALVRAIAASPVPVVSGIGHETDFTLADFVADLRAPTPTAAAELVAAPREVWLGALELMQQRLGDAAVSRLDRQSQRLDLIAARLGRPSSLLARQQQRLLGAAHALHHALGSGLAGQRNRLQTLDRALPRGVQAALATAGQRLARAELRLGLLDPSLVLQRGYAWLEDDAGRALTRTAQLQPGQRVKATLSDGKVDMVVSPPAAHVAQ